MEKSQGGNLWERVEKAQAELRNEYRIKTGVDYAVIVHYGKAHVLCQETYEESVREVLARFNVEIETFALFN